MKIKLTILLILLTTFTAAPAFAENRVIDNAGLLNAAEKAALTALMDSIASDYNFDLVILTEETILGDRSPAEFAKLYFEINGYGLGDNKDGCMLLQVLEPRRYYIHPSGKAAKILNPTAYNKLESDVVGYIGNGENNSAYRAFVSDWTEFLALDAKGRSYNFFHKYNRVLIIFSWIIALGIGFIVVLVWKKGMNTVLAQTQAQAYVVSGSLKYYDKKDTFLNSKTTKTKRQSSSGFSGSSARRTAGRGGKY